MPVASSMHLLGQPFVVPIVAVYARLPVPLVVFVDARALLDELAPAEEPLQRKMTRYVGQVNAGGQPINSTSPPKKYSPAAEQPKLPSASLHSPSSTPPPYSPLQPPEHSEPWA